MLVPYTGQKIFGFAKIPTAVLLVQLIVESSAPDHSATQTPSISILCFTPTEDVKKNIGFVSGLLSFETLAGINFLLSLLVTKIFF